MNSESYPGTLFVFSAPSGAGKTSLVKALLQNMDGIAVSVSHTTRAMRPGEENGVHYHFVDIPEFEKMVAGDAFLEHAKVFDNYYGTSRTGIEQQLALGMDVILEIDWQGAAQVRKLMPETVGVFILPPSRDALEQRLRGRGQDSDEIIARRMRDAQSESAHYHEFEYVVVNDDFDTALAELQAIVTCQRQRLPAQQWRYGKMIEGLLAQ
ncbi:MAG: guanylate kinase [Gammaproteobacteria bacterium]|nr:guanylate kinase [Gammaproteobacteria bacterium]